MVDTILALARAVPHRHELVILTDHSLAHEKASSEIKVGARSSHRDRKRLPANPKFQRLFARQGIAAVRGGCSDGNSKNVSLWRNATHFVLTFSSNLGRATERK